MASFPLPDISFPDGIPIGNTLSTNDSIVRPTDYYQEFDLPQNNTVSRSSDISLVTLFGVADGENSEIGRVTLTSDGYVDSITGDCVNNPGISMSNVVYHYFDTHADGDCTFMEQVIAAMDENATAVWNSRYGWIKQRLDQLNGWTY